VGKSVEAVKALQHWSGRRCTKRFVQTALYPDERPRVHPNEINETRSFDEDATSLRFRQRHRRRPRLADAERVGAENSPRHAEQAFRAT
jgi:hypothetical protein